MNNRDQTRQTTNPVGLRDNQQDASLFIKRIAPGPTMLNVIHDVAIQKYRGLHVTGNSRQLSPSLLWFAIESGHILLDRVSCQLDGPDAGDIKNGYGRLRHIQEIHLGLAKFICPDVRRFAMLDFSTKESSAKEIGVGNQVAFRRY